MLTTLIIARHGNTFGPDDQPRRVGARTDIPLVQSGQDQAHRLGEYLYNHNLVPDQVFTSKLKRTRQMAELASQTYGTHIPTQATDIFNEIDYGFDENKTEDMVLARIGEDGLHAWEKYGILPEGWSPSVSQIRRNWEDFAADLTAHHEGRKTLVITSNGIARFALYLTGNWQEARMRFGLKLSTGALGILTHKKGDDHWSVVDWNVRP